MMNGRALTGEANLPFSLATNEGEKRLLEERLVRKGDVIGIVAGTPMGIRGTTNFMKFHVIGGQA